MEETVADRIKTKLKTKTGNSRSFASSKIFKELNNVDSGSADRLRALVEEGENVLLRGSYDETYLHVICTPVSKELNYYLVPLVFILVEAGLDVNAKDKEGNTPLHVCAINELDERICEAFLRLGGDPDSANSYEQTPLELADIKTLKDLMQYYRPGLGIAVEQNNYDDIKRLTDAWCIPDHTLFEEVADHFDDDDFDSRICKHFEQVQPRLVLIENALSGNHEDVKQVVKDYFHGNEDEEILDGYQLEKFDRKWPLLAEVVQLELWECAKVLIKITDLDQIIDSPEGDPIPLNRWILETPSQKSVPFLKALLKKSDIQNFDALSVIYNSWKEGQPLSEILECFIKVGFNLATRDSDGLTLRDLVLRDIYQDDLYNVKATLYEIDQFVIKLATDGKVSRLNQLLNDGYDYIMVEDLKGRTIKEKAEMKMEKSETKKEKSATKKKKSATKKKKSKKKKENAEMKTENEETNTENAETDAENAETNEENAETNKEVIAFLDSVPKLQATMREVHKAVELGNLQRLKRTMDDKLVSSRDRGGRSLMHKAILYERVYIIKYLLKTYPNIVNIKDNNERTPLHYAMSLIDGDEIEDQLIAMGADEMEPDKHGHSALDYKTSIDGTDVMKQEREKEYGGKVAMLHHYLVLTEAIQSGDPHFLSEMVTNMGGVELDELNTLPLVFDMPVFRPLLFQCIESKLEDMALVLVNAGADCNIAAKIPKKDGSVHLLTLIQAAEMHGLNDLATSIREKLVREDERSRRGMAFRNAVTKMQISDVLAGSRDISRFSTSHSNSPPPAKRQLMEQSPEKRQAALVQELKEKMAKAKKNRENQRNPENQDSSACVIL